MKACKNCRYIIEHGTVCPSCQGSEFSDKFNSQIMVFDADKSEIARKMGAKIAGKYAVRIK